LRAIIQDLEKNFSENLRKIDFSRNVALEHQNCGFKLPNFGKGDLRTLAWNFLLELASGILREPQEISRKQRAIIKNLQE